MSQPKVYMKSGPDGGDEQVIASGGTQTVESGGVVDLEAGGILRFPEMDITAGTDRVVKVAKVALAAETGAGGVLAWENPESSAILVQRIMFDVTTPADGSATIDVGVAADGTTSDDTLIDGADIGAAAGVFDNIDDQGTNGESKLRLDENGGTTAFVTGTASADPAGLVGNAYIEYVVV